MMKQIKILGTGCPKCKQLTALVTKVVKENNMEANIEKVEDIMKIMSYNVLSTPAVVVDGKIVVSGRIPSAAELRDLFDQ